MVWQDDEDSLQQLLDECTMTDVGFRVSGDKLLRHYALALDKALADQLSQWSEDARVSALLSIANEEGNGWFRGDDDELLLSRRARLTLRVPVEWADEVEALIDTALQLEGYTLTLSQAKRSAFNPHDTVYTRHLALDADDEQAFMVMAAGMLKTLGVRPRKMICGRARQLQLGEDTLTTRSLMIADLKPEESLRIQEHGLGPHRRYGCGVFVPYKSIASLN